MEKRSRRSLAVGSGKSYHSLVFPVGLAELELVFLLVRVGVPLEIFRVCTLGRKKKISNSW